MDRYLGTDMALIEWFPSLTTTSLFAAALWLSRKLIATRLTASVEHEFNSRLEDLRANFREREEQFKAELRSRQEEIAALRSGAITAMTSRQVALDQRRLQAVDQLWESFTALAPAKFISSYMSVIKFETTANEAVRDERVRKMFEVIGGGFNENDDRLKLSAKARPFVTPMVWAIFSAYQAIAYLGVFKLKMITAGIGAKDFYDKAAVSRMAKAALPHHAETIDQHGEAIFHHLLDLLEEKLLIEVRNMLAGSEGDKASVEQAAEIVRLVNKVREREERPEVALANAHRD